MRIGKELKSLFGGIGTSKKKAKAEAKTKNISFQEIGSSEIQDDAKKLLTLYQLMSEQPAKFLLGKLGRESLQQVVNRAVGGTLLAGLKVMEDELDFAFLGRKMQKLPQKKAVSEIVAAYNALFSALYSAVSMASGKNSATALFKEIYGSVLKNYGPHLELAVVRVLPPEIVSSGVKLHFMLAAYGDFANDFAQRLHDKGVEIEPKDIGLYFKGALKGAEFNPDYTFNFIELESNAEKLGDDRIKIICSSFGNLIGAIYDFGSSSIGQKGTKKLIDASFSYAYSKYSHSPVEHSLQAVMPRDTLHEEKELEILADCYETFANEISQRLHEKDLAFGQESVEPVLTLALEGIKLNADYKFDFSKVPFVLSKLKGDRKKQLAASFANLITFFYNFGSSELGSENMKHLLSDSYNTVQENYGYGPLSLRILTAVPKGILEPEKLDLLTKGELEKVTKERMHVDELKDQFMNIAAHELKTPLIPIIGYVDLLLKDKAIPQKEKKQLQIILEAAQREKKLVDDILDISKLESGAMKFYMSEVKLHDLIEEVAKELQSAAVAKKLKLESHVPKELPIVYADPKRLSQVIGNLAGNAIKFTQKGGVAISAEKRRGDIVISVRDTGIGIPKDALPKLFTKFYQIDSSANRKAGGTGLGLAITKEIVEAHGGKIWVASRPGRGATFSFNLPLRRRKKSR